VAWLLGSATLATSQAAVNVIRVSTPQELMDAITDGAPHVHIINHLNLTTLPSAPGDDEVPSVFRPIYSLQSMTVRVDAWNGGYLLTGVLT
jgi:hypothetical protein